MNTTNAKLKVPINSILSCSRQTAEQFRCNVCLGLSIDPIVCNCDFLYYCRKCFKECKNCLSSKQIGEISPCEKLVIESLVFPCPILECQVKLVNPELEHHLLNNHRKKPNSPTFTKKKRLVEDVSLETSSDSIPFSFIEKKKRLIKICSKKKEIAPKTEARKECEFCDNFIEEGDRSLHEEICQKALILCDDCKKNIQKRNFTSHNNGLCFNKMLQKYEAHMNLEMAIEKIDHYKDKLNKMKSSVSQMNNQIKFVSEIEKKPLEEKSQKELEQVLPSHICVDDEQKETTKSNLAITTAFNFILTN